MVGHLVGLAAVPLAVLLLHAGEAPAVLSTGQLTLVRVAAAVFATGLTLLGGLLLRASHPPAAATTLLVAFGGFKMTLHQMTVVIAGALIVALAGEGIRQLRLRGR